MKNSILFSLLFIFIAYTAQASEPSELTTTTTLSFDQIVEKIEKIINSNHHRNNFFSYFFYAPQLEELLFDIELEEKDVLIILGALIPYCTDEKITEKLFQALYKKNSVFKQLHEYCVSKEVKSLENITCDTLTTVEKLQVKPSDTFNTQLQSLPIKQYLIKKGLEIINPTYNMQLTGHTGSLKYADTCITTGYAVTSSYDNNIRFWDLNNGGKCIAAFHNEPVCVCFNKTGSHFATAHNHEKCTVIKQWTFAAPSFQPELTHSTETIPLVSYIAYCNDNTLVVIGDKQEDPYWNTHFCQTILKFKKNKIVSTLGTVYLTTHNAEIKNWKEVDKDLYTTRVTSDSMIITKKSYPLYLCKQAIKNSSATIELQTKIKSSLSYQQLTTHEKEMILQDITAKAAPLQEKQ